MRSWLSTQASTDVSLQVTLDRHRLADLLAPMTTVGDEAILRVTPHEIVVRAADDSHVRSVTTTLDADACSKYAITPGRLTFDPATLHAALAPDAAVSADTDPVTLAYANGDETLSVSLPTVTHEQPVDPTQQDQIPRVTEWPDGATLHHPAGTLTEVCEYLAAITEMIAVEYDELQDVFRIESVANKPADDTPRATGTYERSGADLPGETAAATVRVAFDGALLRDVVATAPGDAHVRLDIADSHPLRLGWKSTSPDRSDDTPVEVTALLAPRELPTRDEGNVE